MRLLNLENKMFSLSFEISLFYFRLNYALNNQINNANKPRQKPNNDKKMSNFVTLLCPVGLKLGKTKHLFNFLHL
jgi:hypothetical protein